MKTLRVGLVCIALTLLLGRPALAQTGHDLLQQALVMEQAEGNLQAAIQLYGRILEEFSSDRPLAAEALMHIGLCHEKLGSQEAQRAYERLLREYADQTSVADQARLRLASLQGLARVEAPTEDASGSGVIVRNVWGGHAHDEVGVSGGPSPDGRYLVYVEESETASNIAIWDLVTGESRRLTDHPGYEEGTAVFADFSPDGRTIAYWWFSSDGTGQVRLAFTDGSPPRTLCGEAGYIYMPGSWARDGRRLVVHKIVQGYDGPLEVGWVSVEDGGFQIFGTFFEGRLDALAATTESLSPDGRFLAFDHAVTEDSGRRDISMVPTAGGAEVTIVQHPANDRVVGWVPGTSDFLFGSDRGGKSDLYAIEVVEGEVRSAPRLVRPDVGEMTPMGFTADGDLFHYIYTQRTLINTAPFDPESGSVSIGAAQQLLGSKVQPRWSPDGRSLAFWHRTDRAAGGLDEQILGVTDLDTGEERELATHLEAELPTWSPDGRSILFIGRPRNADDGQGPAIFRADLETGQATELVRLPPGTDWRRLIGAAWDPNGRDIVYAIDGRLLLHHVASHEETELYRHPGLIPQLLVASPDGRSLLFAVADSTSEGFQRMRRDILAVEGKLMVLRLPEAGIEEVATVELEPGGRIQRVDWGPNGAYVYFTAAAGNESTALHRVPIQGGEVEQVWASQPPAWGLTISPTGQQVAFIRADNRMDIYVMENLASALRESGGGR